MQKTDKSKLSAAFGVTSLSIKKQRFVQFCHLEEMGKRSRSKKQTRERSGVGPLSESKEKRKKRGEERSLGWNKTHRAKNAYHK